MKEFIEKIGRLEEYSNYAFNIPPQMAVESCINITNELAEDSSDFRVPLERGCCCEWKLEENNGIAWHCADEKCSTYNNAYIKNLRIVLEDFECICPYCGKRIKVVEVEGE